MARDDRDRSFEKALALRLRANTPGIACPDAETLAAYHERSLTPDELTSWKTHLASCANCQQILAHLETLDEIPLGALPEQQVSRSASNSLEAGAAAAVAPGSPPAPAAAPKKAAVVSVAQFPKRPLVKHWHWIAPVGAVAAGLLVWVAVHENHPAAVLPAAKIEIAQNRPPADESKLVPPAKPEALDKSASLSKTVPPTGERASVSSALQNRRDMSASKSPASAPLAGRSESVAAESQSAQLSANTQPKQGKKIYGLAPGVTAGTGAAVGGIATMQKEKKFDEPAQQDQAMNYVATPPPAAPKPPSPALAGLPSEQKDGKQLQADQSASAPAPPRIETKEAPQNADALAAKPQASAETVTVTSGAEAAPAFLAAKSRAPRTVSAPGGKVIWRLGFGGLIEHSLDGGQTWTPQKSGTTETLFLGSAPSEQVCWVISISGTILRTADGGTTWLPVASPLSQNLGLIRASDALHATVWDMSRRHIFQTADGGATWTPAPAH